MISAVASLILNLVIIGLLIATIGYCWMLNRRIKILQDSKSELAQLLKFFDESTEKASESIIALQTASKKIGDNIQHRVDKANYLLEDLAFMIEKGSKLADQMEAGFAVSRARAKVLSERELDMAASPREFAGKPVPILEKTGAEKPAPKPVIHARERTNASLEAALERIVGRKSSSTKAEEEDEEPVAKNQRQRSKTEQELLSMLKAGLKG